MTWLSRLLPKSDGFPRRAGDEYRIRSRRGPGRRRMMSLEGLEGRTLLATNLTATYDFATLSLTIVGDTNDDSFEITEGSLVSGGQVTITPTGATPPTINGELGPYTTAFAVRNIVVTLPGTSNNDTVVLTGAGENVSTPVVNVTITATGPNLSFNANNVQNYGTLSVQCTGGSLTAQVDQGRFASLAIAQTGAAPASVEVGGDIIPGRVSVMEGGADGDTISLNLQNGDRYGPIYLAQGTDGSGTGNNDHISVIGASGASAPGATALVSDLTIQQSVNGAANSILVDTVSVLASSFGLRFTQGSGEGNTTTINNITSPPPTPPSNTTPNGSPGISVVQGDGSQDQISVTNSFANPSSIPGGTVSLAQGAGDSDKIIVQGDIFGSNPAHPGDKWLARHARRPRHARGHRRRHARRSPRRHRRGHRRRHARRLPGGTGGGTGGGTPGAPPGGTGGGTGGGTPGGSPRRHRRRHRRRHARRSPRRHRRGHRRRHARRSPRRHRRGHRRRHARRSPRRHRRGHRRRHARRSPGGTGGGTGGGTPGAPPGGTGGGTGGGTPGAPPGGTGGGTGGGTPGAPPAAPAAAPAARPAARARAPAASSSTAIMIQSASPPPASPT